MFVCARFQFAFCYKWNSDIFRISKWIKSNVWRKHVGLYSFVMNTMFGAWCQGTFSHLRKIFPLKIENKRIFVCKTIFPQDRIKITELNWNTLFSTFRWWLNKVLYLFHSKNDFSPCDQFIHFFFGSILSHENTMCMVYGCCGMIAVSHKTNDKRPSNSINNNDNDNNNNNTTNKTFNEIYIVCLNCCETGNCSARFPLF